MVKIHIWEDSSKRLDWAYKATEDEPEFNITQEEMDQMIKWDWAEQDKQDFLESLQNRGSGRAVPKIN